MTVFDPVTDRYLDRLGDAESDATWEDVLRRTRRREARQRRTRVTAVGSVGVAVAAGALAGVGVLGGTGGPSIVEKAQAAAIDGLPPAGQIVHVRDEYRDPSGHAFISYDAWLAADGAWCRGVVEEPVTDYTLCEAGETYELYLPQANEILRASAAGAATGGEFLTTLDDFLATFALEIAGQAGTGTLDGVEYPRLETTQGDYVLVDPDTGQAVAWFPSPAAFGKEVVVRRTSERLTDDAGNRRSLSLEALHPGAPVRDVSPDELQQALGEQYPRG